MTTRFLPLWGMPILLGLIFNILNFDLRLLVAEYNVNRVSVLTGSLFSVAIAAASST